MLITKGAQQSALFALMLDKRSNFTGKCVQGKCFTALTSLRTLTARIVLQMRRIRFLLFR